MFGSRNSPSKNDQLTTSNRDYDRMYSNFSPINSGGGAAALATGMLPGAHSNTHQDFNKGNSLQFHDRKLESALEGANIPAAKIEKLELPFKKEYEIVFHESDVFKMSLVATMD